MITVERLVFAYPGAERNAVDGIDFAVARGEIFGFLGPNGAGKSTTQKILIGLLRGFEGRVEVLGRPLPEWGSDYYEHVGVGFEVPNHYSKLTARENLAYFGALYSEGARDPLELLERLDLAADADTRVGQFSKGMKSRLGVARALVNDPEVLFLDEPTAGLDPVSARRVKALIREERERGKTVFLTTHDMVVADQLCDRVALIVEGRIEVSDAPRALKLRYGEPRVRLEHRADGVIARAEFPIAGLGRNRDFLALLESAKIETLHTLEATLEDVFIRTTGRQLR